MKIIALILLVFISYRADCQSVNDSIIYWTNDNKLKWEDFKGSPPEKIHNESALSFIRIYTKANWHDGLPDWKVFATFEKYHSWTKNDSSLFLLEHEQLHFDIGELFARKIRESILKLREKNDTSTSHYLQVLDSLFHKCKEVGSLYDKETDHGVYRKEQEMWNKKIAKDLLELKKFEVDH